MIVDVEIAGHAWPVNFGLRALGSLSTQLGVNITELGAMMSDAAPMEEKIDVIEAIAMVGLNDGARLRATGRQVTLAEVDDMLMQDMGAIERIMSVFAKSLECVSPMGDALGVTAPQKKTNRSRNKGRR